MRGNRFGMNQLPHYNFNHSSNKIPSAPLEGKSKILQWQQSLKSKHKNSTKGNITPLIINTLYVTSCFKGRTFFETWFLFSVLKTKEIDKQLIIKLIENICTNEKRGLSLLHQTYVLWNMMLHIRCLLSEEWCFL